MNVKQLTAFKKLIFFNVFNEDTSCCNTTYDKTSLFPKRNRRLTLSHTELPFMADKLHRMLKHVGEEAEEGNEQITN